MDTPTDGCLQDSGNDVRQHTRKHSRNDSDDDLDGKQFQTVDATAGKQSAIISQQANTNRSPHSCDQVQTNHIQGVIEIELVL